MVYPVLQLEPVLPEDKSKALAAFWRTISKLEKKRKSRIFCVIHCGEQDDHICGPTFCSALAHRAEIKNIDTLELLIHSPGGSADVAYQLIRIFRRHCKKLNALVPLMAKSAATLMCLGADAIYMGEFADLGPIDVQIHDPIEKGAKTISPLNEFKSTEFLRDYAVELLDFFTALIIRRSGMSVKEALHESIGFTTGIMRPLYEQLDPLEVGEYKRAIAIGEEYASRLLAKNPHRKTITEALVSKYPSHGFVIDRVEARALGLPAHPLDSAQETLLLDALTSITSYGESLYGFAKVPAKQPSSKAAKPKGKQPAIPAAPKPPTLAVAG